MYNTVKQYLNIMIILMRVTYIPSDQSTHVLLVATNSDYQEKACSSTFIAKPMLYKVRARS